MPSEMIIGNSRVVLRDLFANRGSFLHSTVTSPEYWGKLDYGHEDQLGLTVLPSEYLESLAEVFTSVYNLTLPGGALIINIGETWNNYSVVRTHLRETKEPQLNREAYRRPKVAGYTEKEALGIPEALLGTLRGLGWLHRDTWIWNKGKPGRPTKSDRPAASHEMIYYFRKPSGGVRYREAYWDGTWIPSSVITVAPEGHPLHPCPFPPGLARPLVLATTPETGYCLDPFAGTGTVNEVCDLWDRNGLGVDLRDWSLTATTVA